MFLKKNILVVCSCLFVVQLMQAQVADLLVSDLDVPGEWSASEWSKVDGRIAVRPEAPLELQDADPPATESLGVKIDWPGGEGFRFFSINPSAKVPIPYHVNSLKFWVHGSDTPHFCEIILQDANGDRQKLKMGKIYAARWLQLEKDIPSKIVQPVIIMGITIHDWGNPTPGETTMYLSRLEANVDLSQPFDDETSEEVPAAKKKRAKDEW